VRDLLLCAKHLFFAAILAGPPEAHTAVFRLPAPLNPAINGGDQQMFGAKQTLARGKATKKQDGQMKVSGFSFVLPADDFTKL
jgi:hypothetical protein